MKIAIDITYNPSGGSISQIINMVKYFNQIENIDLVIYTNRKNIDILKNVIKDNNKIVKSWLASLSVVTRIIWEQLLLPFYLKKDRIDILFCPGNIAPYISPVKTVQWIGTIGPFYNDFYHHFRLYDKIITYINKIFMYISARRSDAVIFESNFTMKLFIDEYKLSPERSYVINIGKSEFFYPIKPQEVKKLSSRYDSFKPYVLCASHLYPYKNIVRMLKAFKIALDATGVNLKLVLAGSRVSQYYNEEILRNIEHLFLQESVIFLGSVSKEDLRYLYSQCEFLIFPSPYENFAYTLVEAMSCGAAILVLIQQPCLKHVGKPQFTLIQIIHKRCQKRLDCLLMIKNYGKHWVANPWIG